jgi:hypothetical protein
MVRPQPLKHGHYPMAMTIALGILMKETLVLAADTEITAGDAKTEGGKIYWAADASVSNKNTGILAVTGAGDVAHLETAYCDLKELFLKHRSDSVEELGIRFRKLIKQFHKDYVVPYAYAPDRPDIWLIVAVRRNSRFRMWTSNKSTLRPVIRNYAAVGIGQMQAQELFNLLNKRMDHDTAKALAIYAVYRIKQVVQGVGKSTHIFSLGKEGIPYGMSEFQIEELEKMFRFYNGLEAQLVHWALGSNYPFAEASRVQKLIDHARVEIKKLLHDNRPINSDNSQA